LELPAFVVLRLRDRLLRYWQDETWFPLSDRMALFKWFEQIVVSCNSRFPLYSAYRRVCHSALVRRFCSILQYRSQLLFDIVNPTACAVYQRLTTKGGVLSSSRVHSMFSFPLQTHDVIKAMELARHLMQSGQSPVAPIVLLTQVKCVDWSGLRFVALTSRFACCLLNDTGT